MQIVLDPQTSAERVAAFADFFSHDEPDFAGYCARVRARATGLFPAEVRLVDSPDELRAALPDARAAVLESLAFGRTEIAAARNLKAVQKYGVGLRTIDSRGLRRARHQGAHHPPPRQHRLRRARPLPDAGAGQDDQTADRPHQRRCARRDRLSLSAVRPPPHALFQLAAYPRRAHAQRGDARHHRPRRDRPRDRAARQRLRHARPVLPAHAIAGSRGAADADQLRHARRSARAERLGGAAAPRRPWPRRPDRPPAACAHEAGRLNRQRLAARRDQPRGFDRGVAVRPSRRLRARSAIRGARPRRRRAAAIRQRDADAAYCRAAALQRARRFRRYDRGAWPGRCAHDPFRTGAVTLRAHGKRSAVAPGCRRLADQTGPLDRPLPRRQHRRRGRARARPEAQRATRPADSSSTTASAPAAISAPTPSRRPRRTATRSAS